MLLQCLASVLQGQLLGAEHLVAVALMAGVAVGVAPMWEAVVLLALLLLALPSVPQQQPLQPLLLILVLLHATVLLVLLVGAWVGQPVHDTAPRGRHRGVALLAEAGGHGEDRPAGVVE